jgi:hypothetical protein
MESLLSLAFDNLSSFDGAKIKKGLKQVEGLLAQICLSGPSSSSSSSNNSPSSPRKLQQSAESAASAKDDRESTSLKGLGDLGGDPAFREFFKLQEGFEWNIAQRLLTTLDWLVVRGGDGQYDLLIVNALDLIQGVLLLHPPSKVLFSRNVHMNVSRLYLALALGLAYCALQSTHILSSVLFTYNLFLLHFANYFTIKTSSSLTSSNQSTALQSNAPQSSP